MSLFSEKESRRVKFTVAHAPEGQTGKFLAPSIIISEGEFIEYISSLYHYHNRSPIVEIGIEKNDGEEISVSVCIVGVKDK